MIIEIITCLACTDKEGVKMNLEEIVKSYAKEDADFSGLSEQIGSYTNLSELTAGNIIETLKKVPHAISAYDSVNRSSVETGVNNFKSGKMLAEWKEKEAGIRAEINPKETAEQKEIRELKEWKHESINSQKLSDLKDELSVKAKELEFDPIKARDFAIHGENAIGKLEEYAGWMNETITTRLSNKIKDQYSPIKPKTSSVKIEDIDSQIMEARKSGNSDLALKLQMLKNAPKGV